MITLVQVFFVFLLFFILIMLYKSEMISAKKSLPKARIEEYWNGKERRKHIRFKKMLEINYVVRKKPHIKNNCKTIDISEGGAKIFLDEKLSKGAIMDLHISIPDSKEIVAIEGEVVWSEDASQDKESGKRFFYCGIKFFAIKEPSQVSLIEYIRSLETSDEGVLA